MNLCDTKNKKTVTKIGRKCKTSARRYSIVELAGLKKEERNKERKEDKIRFLTRVVRYVRNCCFIVLLMHILDIKSLVLTMVVFKMCESIPSTGYSSICNVLHL